MDVSTLQTIGYIGIPIFSLLVIPLFRNIFMRIRDLENNITRKVTEPEVRQLLSDKLEPVQTDLKEIKGQLNQIIARLLDNK